MDYWWKLRKNPWNAYGMLKNRNDLTYIYDELEAKRLVGIILKEYIPAFVKMQKGIEAYYGSELENI